MYATGHPLTCFTTFFPTCVIDLTFTPHVRPLVVSKTDERGSPDLWPPQVKSDLARSHRWSGVHGHTNDRCVTNARHPKNNTSHQESWHLATTSWFGLMMTDSRLVCSLILGSWPKRYSAPETLKKQDKLHSDIEIESKMASSVSVQSVIVFCSPLVPSNWLQTLQPTLSLTWSREQSLISPLFTTIPHVAMVSCLLTCCNL